ncbi:putative membrane protein [Friedmanniella endophytica]|uniref:Putative membrane protein n=1 Tax=Microlunatus kandeliicorticis TaxID=1759536 RepID=A0A7W3IVU3_9ACTN|nr:DUF1361 domain-containing protein [Microlunatus kandeliicorticis]MBA8796211.1 putative membrane protein [Microlunatus kandeliicorticis]
MASGGANEARRPVWGLGPVGGLVLLTVLVAGLSVAALGLRAFRAHHVGVSAFDFMPWNLFLAWIPYLLALLIAAVHRSRGPRPLLVALGLAWLLFLPNAPYLVTDVIHLGTAWGAPLWFDAGLIALFAGTGLALGLASLLIVHRVVEARLGRLWGWCVAVGSLVLSAVGIYLGRYPRFNSWDVITNPHGLLATVLHRLTDPLGNPFLLKFGLLTSTLLLGSYLLVWLVGRFLVRPAHPVR